MSADISPDCAAGKHPACNGEGWDHEADEVGTCPCDCHLTHRTPSGVPVRRYSVCTPTAPHPTEVSSHNNRDEALAAAGSGEVVYDWATGEVIS